MSEIVVLKRPVQCPECGYRWNTESQNFYVSCPRCRYTVKIREKKKEKEKVATSGRAGKHNQTAATGLLQPGGSSK